MVCLSLLAASMAYTVGYKRYVLRRDARYQAVLEAERSGNAASGDQFFWTENALHFRHARMISRGEPIPEIDRRMQWPGGMNVRRYMTPLMDRVYGTLHRWGLGGDLPLWRFLIAASMIVSTLTAVGVFVGGWAVGGSPWGGLVASVLHGLSVGANVRTLAGAYNREGFALVFIAGALGCYLAACRQQRRRWSVVGAACLFVALGAWHVSVFFFLVFMLAVWGASVLRPRQTSAPRQLLILVAGAVAAGVFWPHLWPEGFLWSAGMLLAYTMLLVGYLGAARRNTAPVPQRVVFLAAGLAALGLAALLAGRLAAYSHVYALMLAKSRHLGQLPVDPTVIPFEARALWNSSFVTPRPFLIALYVGPSLVIALVAITLMLRRRRGAMDHGRIVALLLAAGCLVLFAAVERLGVFAAMAIPVVAAGIVPVGRHRSHVWLWPVLGVVCAIQLVCQYHPALRLVARRPDPAALHTVSNWLTAHTGPDDTVLSRFQFGPSFCTYADRPIVLQPKWETAEIRRRVEDAYSAWLADEEEFFGFCTRYDVRHVVYDAGILLAPDEADMIYQTGRSAISTRSAAFAMQFAPRTLKHFRPVFHHGTMRVYRVGATANAGVELPFNAAFDPQVLGWSEPHDSFTHADALRATANLSDWRFLGSWSLRAARAGALDQANALIQASMQRVTRAGRLSPQAGGVLYRIVGGMALAAGDARSAMAYLGQALQGDGGHPATAQLLAAALSTLGDRENAVKVLQSANARTSTPALKTLVAQLRAGQTPAWPDPLSLLPADFESVFGVR